MLLYALDEGSFGHLAPGLHPGELGEQALRRVGDASFDSNVQVRVLELRGRKAPTVRVVAMGRVGVVHRRAGIAESFAWRYFMMPRTCSATDSNLPAGRAKISNLSGSALILIV